MPRWRILLVLGWALSGSLALSEGLTIRALNGKNGEPIKGEHLLVFVGENQRGLQSHAVSFDLKTDEHGVAILSLDGPQLSLIQVWVDFHTQCTTNPNVAEYSVTSIESNGIVAENNCGKTTSQARPKTLTIYARPAHWWEGLRW
jgi:hypothetical protein